MTFTDIACRALDGCAVVIWTVLHLALSLAGLSGAASWCADRSFECAGMVR